MLEQRGERITVVSDERTLHVALAPSVYPPARRRIFFDAIANLLRLRLQLGLSSDSAGGASRSEGARWTLQTPDELAAARLRRALRYLATLVEGGVDPFEALGRLERLDLRWPALIAALAQSFPGLRAHPTADGHLLQVAEGGPGDRGPGYRLLLDPGASPSDLELRLVLHVWVETLGLGRTTGQDALISWARQGLLLRLGRERSAADGPAPPGAVALTGTLSSSKGMEGLLGSVQRLAFALKEGVEAHGAGKEAPWAAFHGPGATAVGLPHGVAQPSEGAARPVANGRPERPSPPARVASRPSPERHDSPRSASAAAGGVGPQRLVDLRRARELGLPPPPVWPEHLEPARPRVSGADAAHPAETTPVASARSAVAHRLAPHDIAQPAGDRRPALADWPDRLEPEPREQAAPVAEEPLDSARPVDLVLVSAGPFPTELKRVLSILLSVDYPRAGALVEQTPTVLLHRASLTLAQRYAQVVRRAGGRFRIAQSAPR